MSLDKNLFTLQFTPVPGDPNVTDLVDPSGVAHYRKHRAKGATYEINVYDPISGSLLITGASPSPSSRQKTLELFNPSIVVELRDVGKVSFRWSFKWEDHQFEWKKEECYMVRKPDPPVLVAVTSEPPARIKTGTVQILDYNLNRFDIADRKGLEIVMLTALFTFSDLNESYHEARPTVPRRMSPGAPPVPPKPEPRVGIERIAEMQAYKGEVNEVVVEDEGEVEDYAGHSWNLLKDEAMLFISVRSATVENVPKVLRIVEEIKRLRHKAGLDEEGELHPYVIYEQEKKGPKIIKLDGRKGKSADVEKYTPPTSLTVHLSKIDMPELKPRATSQPSDKTIMEEWGRKEKEKRRDQEKGKEKEKPTKKDKRKEDDKKQKGSPSPPPGKFGKPSGSSRPPPSPVYQTPPPIPHHNRPMSDVWALYPSQFQPPYQQQSGVLNTGAPPPPPPQTGSVVSNLMGRLDRFARR